MKTFAERLTREIDRRGIKIYRVCEVCEISHYKLSAWMKGRIIPAPWEELGFLVVLNQLFPKDRIGLPNENN